MIFTMWALRELEGAGRKRKYKRVSYGVGM